jgi:cytochrome oxidase Cu insertion factor (SCO1/SenC/PrrC family)
MPGMNSSLSPASPILVAAFRSALLRQWLVIMLVLAFLLIAWALTRIAFLRPGGRGPAATAAGWWREPRARWLLRVGFGVLWLADGLLQAQPQMPGGLADQVIKPSAGSSPAWVQDLVNYGVNLWDYHPIQAASATVWIQVGIGLWMLVAVRGRSARLAGLAGAAWGLIVWAFGEAFGGIFAPGLSVLFGAPGGALLYVVAGALLALPERAWDRPWRPGRLLLGGTGAFFLGMALLQAWPGRGFWQGRADGGLGSLTAMIASMAGTPQPRPIDAIVSGFGNLAVAHGFAVNLVAVIALAAVGAGLLLAAVRPDARRLALIAVIAGAVFCLADWIVVEDLGFLGGLGTDPNSMIPLILLFTAGYLGLSPGPAEVPELTAYLAAPTGGPEPAEDRAEPAAAPEPSDDDPEAVPAARRAGRVHELVRAVAGMPVRVVAGMGAFAVVLAGAAPMALATTNPNADPITAQAIAGSTGQFDVPAANFTLTSQDGRQVSLASLRGKVVLLTFIDPVCTTDCPIIAQEMRSADALLGARASDTELVAVVANPTYTSLAYTRAFTSQENLGPVGNWLFLTGSLGQLSAVWHAYGMQVEDLPAGAMAAHNDLAFVIGADGMLRRELSDDPGPATAATQSSFAGLMADSVLATMSR